jgi:hypothetical protein
VSLGGSVGEGAYRDRPVRTYVITGGRVRPSRNTIGPEALLVAAGPEAGPVRGAGRLVVPSTGEQRALLRMCERLLSVAEAAAHLGLPVSVVAVVASDLVDAGLLTARSGIPPAGRPDRALLQEVLDGLRKL